jgi:hypothetical protein
MQNTNLIYSDNAILVSKASALRTIIDLLSINDIETILSARNSSYHSSDRIYCKMVLQLQRHGLRRNYKFNR